jgi:ribosomal protein L16 Arg81 hydroxylase
MTENKAKNDWIYEDLPFFLPKKNFFMVQPEDYRGINCRLGSKGIIAETHYDFSRNFILILRGQKRYVLAHPNQCQNLELHPPGHPSARHSSVNWSDPSAWGQGNFPQAMVNEVIMQAGDILYLPTAWFHFIVSLNMNYQCNARSGITLDYEEDIQDCGFK